MLGKLMGTLAVAAGVGLGAAAVQAEEISLAHKGLTLQGNLELAEGTSLEDGVLLLTHGTLGHYGMEIIATLQEVFKEQGKSSLAINLSLGLDRRQGMYDCPTPHTHKHTDALDEIGAWLEWLEGQGAKEVVLVGHSRGGNQTAWFAAERGHPLVQAVVLIAPATSTPEREAAEYQQRHGTALAPVLKKAKDLGASGKNNRLKPVGFLYCEDTAANAETFVNYYEPDPRRDTPQLLGKIGVPTLVVAGSQDTTVPDLPARVAPLADGAKLHFVEIEGADHFFRDLYAYDVVEAAVQFLDR